jgi:hypothetical protein
MFQALSPRQGFKKTVSRLSRTLIMTGFALTCFPASANAISIDTSYAISVAGTIVADVKITLNENANTYSMDMEASVSGLGNFVARGSANIKATGDSNNTGFNGNNFHLQPRSSEGAVDVTVQYNNGNVSAFIIDPPLSPRADQIPLQRSQLHNVNDMLSAFVIKGERLDASLCNRKLQIFTGVERFDLVMRYAASETATSMRTGYQGPVILCQLDYNPISGHFTNSEITAYLQTSERILIWYAPTPNSNIFIPYRALVGTALGDLSMVLTRLN